MRLAPIVSIAIAKHCDIIHLRKGAAMIRRARSVRRCENGKEMVVPSPEQIRRMTEEIRKHWSSKQLARRSGGATRVHVMMVSAVDVEWTPSEEPGW